MKEKQWRVYWLTSVLVSIAVSAHYGIEYFGSVIDYLEATTNTQYRLIPDKIQLLENAFLDGIAWIIYQQQFDENQTGRFIGEKNPNAYLNHLERLLRINNPTTRSTAPAP